MRMCRLEIPDNWVWTTLGEVGTWQSGGTPSRSNNHIMVEIYLGLKPEI